ncbi:sigma-70 family RNA polymerase sigma factor [bacterium]|nr:sigma-70 family RNA polymerase sigma factor [bacterium]
MPLVSIRQVVDGIYRAESRRVFATLVRMVGDFDLAEDAMQEAFAAAVERWSADGIPENPRAWLVSTGRFKAIDSIRRRESAKAGHAAILERLDQIQERNGARAAAEIEDDRLRLIFTCCHPAIAEEVQIALTLREVCGLTTEEIARAFLTSPQAMAQRLVRGKAKIRDAGIPFELPEADAMEERLDAVLAVIYLVFNEGYSPSSGVSVVRADLSAEAIRLGRLVAERLPDSETLGLLALMLLHESRRTARTDAEGGIVTLEFQDRSAWNEEAIAEGLRTVSSAFQAGPVGPYAIQAAIAAVHAEAKSAESTDWGRIVALYEILRQQFPSPVIDLNHAVALAMRDGPEAGLPAIVTLTEGKLAQYHLAHAARADLSRRMGRMAEAEASYRKALELARLEPERKYLARRIAESIGS